MITHHLWSDEWTSARISKGQLVIKEGELPFYRSSKPSSRFWFYRGLFLVFALLVTYGCLNADYHQISSKIKYVAPSLSGSQNPAYLIKAQNGAVASENYRCSLIGVEALKDGGNAVDAAISAGFCLGVVNMFSYVSVLCTDKVVQRTLVQLWCWWWGIHDYPHTTEIARLQLVSIYRRLSGNSSCIGQFYHVSA